MHEQTCYNIKDWNQSCTVNMSLKPHRLSQF